jgi:hypothetical protein
MDRLRQWSNYEKPVWNWIDNQDQCVSESIADSY